MRSGMGTACALLLGFTATVQAQDNLAPNPGFDTDVSGWTPTVSQVSWNAADRAGSASSGSLQVANVDAAPRNNEGPYVCFPTEAGTVVEAGAWAFLSAGEAEGARSITVVTQHESEDCSGNPTLHHFSNRTQPRDEWALQNTNVTVQHGTRSLRLYLSAFPSGDNQVEVTALFDDAFFREVEYGAFVFNPSVSTSWYDPEQSGHGIMINMVTKSQAWMCWYTFDNSGAPAWICALGSAIPIIKTLTFNEAFTVEGGFFPPDFDKDNVSSVPWGSITIEFTSCNEGTMEWTTDAPGFQSGSMPLTRLLLPWGTECE